MDGNWHHVAVVNNGGTFQNYVDGLASGSSSSLSPNVVAGGQFLGKNLSSSNYFNGLMDEVAVYSRALLASEISNHYLRGALRMEFQVQSCSQFNCSGGSIRRIH